MKESNTIDQTLPQPNTVFSLEKDLRSLGISTGMTVIVHSSLSSIGWVCGGAVAVILALENVLGRAGTLIMPTHSGDLSEPSEWKNPPVPQAWWQTIRESMPVFDRSMTPTRGMGAIAESFRKQDGVLRSSHPNCSFAAWGRYRKHVTKTAKLDFSMDINSPLGYLYRADGYVLLLGVGHDRNTSLHLAEYLAEYYGKRVMDCFAPVLQNGNRVWKKYQDVAFYGNDFEEIGKEFEKTGNCRFGKVGTANARLMRQKELVDFGRKWIEEHRSRSRN
jgi:aminoglycoside 3-N-acetyltransferase